MHPPVLLSCLGTGSQTSLSSSSIRLWKAAIFSLSVEATRGNKGLLLTSWELRQQKQTDQLSDAVWQVIDFWNYRSGITERQHIYQYHILFPKTHTSQNITFTISLSRASSNSQVRLSPMPENILLLLFTQELKNTFLQVKFGPKWIPLISDSRFGSFPSGKKFQKPIKTS